MTFNEKLALRAAGRSLKDTQEFLDSEYPGYTVDDSNSIYNKDGEYVATLIYPTPNK